MKTKPAPALLERATEEVQPGMILDFNADGKVVGIELLALSQLANPDQFKVLRYETV